MSDDDGDLAPLLSRVTSRYRSASQSHVLSHLNDLSESETVDFLRHLDSIDVESLGPIFASAVEEQERTTGRTTTGGESGDDVTPFTGRVGSTSSPDLIESSRPIGMGAIRRGEVAAVLLAGGQGTRLGFDGPKGMYDVGLPSGRTLFRLVAERILRLTRLAAEEGGDGDDGDGDAEASVDGDGDGDAEAAERAASTIPLYIMTSPMNRDDTVDYFERNDYFGLPPGDVTIFTQGVLPCLDPTGKILLETPHRCSMAPDGNGGVYPAMERSGVLSDMERRGVRHVHAFAIDNALVRPADPVFVGYCISSGADCGNKVLWKTGPHEKVGVVAERGGRPCVVEYSDLSKDMAELVDGEGKLVYGAGNMCNHYYTLDFLRDIVIPNVGNMYHVARKKIPVWDFEASETVRPDTNNGIKLESFIFDAFPLSRSMAVLDVDRAEEFAPVKNAPGSDYDSPETARGLMSDLAKRWMVDAGATLVGETRSNMCEVGPLTSYAGEGLGSYRGREVRCPFSI